MIVLASEVPASAASLATLSTAFRDDPALVWLLAGDSARRQEKLRTLFAAAVRESLDRGLVLTAEDESAVSLWRSPGVDEPGVFELLASAPALVGLFRHRIVDAFRLLTAMHKRHPRDSQFLYLQYVGVHPHAQGRGLGRAVIGAGLERADAAGVPVVLETAKADNVPLYRRMGFEVTDQWRLNARAPEFWTMLRPVSTQVSSALSRPE